MPNSIALRIHVVKVLSADKNKPVFYSHFNDEGHDPCCVIKCDKYKACLSITDVFKHKPNVQKNPKTRIDIYMPQDTAVKIAKQFKNAYLQGQVIEDSAANPEAARIGSQKLPEILRQVKLPYEAVNAEIAGYIFKGFHGSLYVDSERPVEEFREMQGPEVHIGIQNLTQSGKLNPELITEVHVPKDELRVLGEINPISKSTGHVSLVFSGKSASNFAATILATIPQ